MFRSILVGFDGSPHAERALSEAVAIARADHATLTVLAVVPDPSLLTGMGSLGFAGANFALVESELEDDYAAHLDAAVEALPPDLSVTKLLVHGRPGPAIVHGGARGPPRPRRCRLARPQRRCVDRARIGQRLCAAPPARRGPRGPRRAGGGLSRKPATSPGRRVTVSGAGPSGVSSRRQRSSAALVSSRTAAGSRPGLQARSTTPSPSSAPFRAVTTTSPCTRTGGASATPGRPATKAKRWSCEARSSAASAGSPSASA